MTEPYSKKYNILIGIIILLSIIAGCYFRFKGLGKWPLAVDEYYFIEAVKNILKYGVPMYDTGGYYARGLLQQYLTAFLLLLGLKVEFGSRLLPVIFNLLTIPGLYLLGKKISGRLIAATLVFIFCFSVWEVEFARFARMYSLFQTIFVWYLYILYKTIFEKDNKSFKWLWLLSFLSILVYEGSIFLVVLNFLPILWNNEQHTILPFSLNVYKNKFFSLLISLVLLFVAYKFLTFDFRNFGQHNLLPPEILDYFRSQKSSGTIREPELLFLSLPSGKVWIVLFSLPLLINIIAFYRVLKFKTSILTRTSILILLILSISNLIGLTLVSFLIFFMIGWLRPEDLVERHQRQPVKKRWEILPSKLLLSFSIAAFVNLVFWLIFAAKTSAWHKLFPDLNISGTGSGIKLLIKASINYPNFYEMFVLFHDVIPIITIITILILGALTVYIFSNYNDADTIKYRFFLFLLLSLLLAVDILNLTYFSTRYFFFLVPLILILSLTGIKIISEFIFRKSEYLRQAAFGAIIIILLIISEDFNYNHLITIDSRDTNFRTHLSMAEKSHYYPRWDMRTTAQIVNKYANPADIVISNEQVNGFYLKRLDYIYIDYRGRLNGVSIDQGKKELWTGANLLYNDKDFLDVLLNKKNTKWLILNTQRGIGFLQQDNFFPNFRKYAVYANPDSSAILYKIPGNADIQAISYILSNNKSSIPSLKN